jgi:hypothetical protein
MLTAGGSSTGGCSTQPSLRRKVARGAPGLLDVAVTGGADAVERPVEQPVELLEGAVEGGVASGVAAAVLERRLVGAAVVPAVEE